MNRAGRRSMRRSMRKKGDLNRAKTHIMRTNDGVKVKARSKQDPSITQAIIAKLEGKEASGVRQDGNPNPSSERDAEANHMRPVSERGLLPNDTAVPQLP